MTASIIFDESCVFDGFSITYRLHDNISKSILIAECFRRLENVLDSLNLNKLKHILKNECFVIKSPIDNIQDGETIYISQL